MEVEGPCANLQCWFLKIPGAWFRVKKGLWLQEIIPKYTEHLLCLESRMFGLRMGSQVRSTKELAVVFITATQALRTRSWFLDAPEKHVTSDVWQCKCFKNVTA